MGNFQLFCFFFLNKIKFFFLDGSESSLSYTLDLETHEYKEIDGMQRMVYTFNYNYKIINCNIPQSFFYIIQKYFLK